MRRMGWSIALVLLLASPGIARAQLTRLTSPVFQPGYGITSADGPETLMLDPAAMAFLASWGVSYVHADAGDTEQMSGRGDGFYAATPILFGIAAGVGVDSVRPLPLTLEPERTMISIGLAWQTDDAIAIGAALRVLASSDVRLAGLTTLDLAATWRPADHLALSFQARDVVGPPLGGGFVETIPRSFVLGTALRPFGNRTFSIDLAGVIDESGRIGARASAELTVPYVGRVLAAAEAERLDMGTPEIRVVSGLAIDWGMIGAGGGVIVGDGYESAPGWYVSGRVEGAEREGIWRGECVQEILLDGSGPRRMIQVSRMLERAIYDDRVVGVLLRPRGSGIGLAYAQEIRLLVEQLQEAGKRVVCHLDDGAGSEWYACAGADRILLDPAGGVRLTGVSSELYYLGDLLRNAGIRADFVRIGAFKSAIEQYQNRTDTPTAREQRERMLDLAYRRLLVDSSLDREMSANDLADIVDRGPHLPRAALEAGLVHALADEHEMDEDLRVGFGGSYARSRAEPWEAPHRWGHRPTIGVVVIDGEITDGDNTDIPLIGIHTTGGRTAVAAIDRMARDPSIRAIVLRIDSPGGSVLASDQIYRAVVRARRRKPVIASMGAIAASGGYYVAAPANQIWADPSTITGSIGVWFGKGDFAPLGHLLGVELETLGRGRHAGATSLYRPFTSEERAFLADAVREWYRQFLRRVARGRGMTVREVDRLARGRVFTGDEALENGLVDHLGGFASALAAARQAAGVGPEVGITVAPGRPDTILDYVLGALGLGAASSDPLAIEAQAAALTRLAPELRAVLSMVMTMRELGSHEPMALMTEVALPH